MKFQYQTISVSPNKLNETLNDKGNKGWRLVSIERKETKVFPHYLYECIFEKIIY